ncbi:hypothetical protein G7Y89_g2728 [Cudoniella acicularis]|uniref:2EXR domain-containing protein n=1 Tax=Cudoniella acicularis TaxID=354080 RepID=A0A8H4RST1_9HELO|nr:hypothetical protein G7Y89_g2728 [Cudoniella acicularis]
MPIPTNDSNIIAPRETPEATRQCPDKMNEEIQHETDTIQAMEPVTLADVLEPLRTFRLFRNLPDRSREMIWSMALEPRLVVLCPQLEDETPTYRRWQILMESPTMTIPCVCREARAQFLRSYTKLESNQAGDNTWIDFSKDTIFLEWERQASCRVVTDFLREHLQTIQSLAIDFNYCMFDRKVYDFLRSSLPHLRELKFAVVSDQTRRRQSFLALKDLEPESCPARHQINYMSEQIYNNYGHYWACSWTLVDAQQINCQLVKRWYSDPSDRVKCSLEQKLWHLSYWRQCLDKRSQIPKRKTPPTSEPEPKPKRANNATEELDSKPYGGRITTIRRNFRQPQAPLYHPGMNVAVSPTTHKRPNNATNPGGPDPIASPKACSAGAHEFSSGKSILVRAGAKMAEFPRTHAAISCRWASSDPVAHVEQEARNLFVQERLNQQGLSIRQFKDLDERSKRHCIERLQEAFYDEFFQYSRDGEWMEGAVGPDERWIRVPGMSDWHVKWALQAIEKAEELEAPRPPPYDPVKSSALENQDANRAI